LAYEIVWQGGSVKQLLEGFGRFERNNPHDVGKCESRHCTFGFMNNVAFAVLETEEYFDGLCLGMTCSFLLTGVV
jgi:hypothetical protein